MPLPSCQEITSIANLAAGSLPEHYQYTEDEVLQGLNQCLIDEGATYSVLSCSQRAVNVGNVVLEEWRSVHIVEDEGMDEKSSYVVKWLEAASTQIHINLEPPHITACYPDEGWRSEELDPTIHAQLTHRLMAGLLLVAEAQFSDY